MIQLSGGIALTSMAGCLGSGDEEPDEDNGDTNDNSTDDDGNDKSTNGETGGGPKSGDDAPGVDLETTDGKEITLDSIDEPTIVMFLDITSEEGKSHSETLADLHEKHGEYVRVITINSDLDASKEDLTAFREEYGGDWDHAMGTEDALGKYGIETAVTVCIIDEDGKIVLRLDGDVNRSTIERAVEAYSDD